jgi:uncharacterized protein (TIGR02246 family)
MYADPQSAEDAYYDAFDEHDLTKMMSVWADSDETVCLLPMFPAIKGRAAIEKAFQPILRKESVFDIEVRHLHWIHDANIAIHLLEERIKTPNNPDQFVYATNVFQKNDQNSWHLTLHQNSPVPAPPKPKA